MLSLSQALILFSLLFLHFTGVNSRSNSNSATFMLVNKCTYTVWPATLTSAGTTPLPTSATGFSLLPGATHTLSVPASWSGRMWARTLCSSGSAGNFSCATGDCRTGSVQCYGSGADPPATLAEFTLSGSGGLDFYDVSLVDGYNLPLVVRAVGGSGNCSAAGCVDDLNESCPSQLRVEGGASGENADGVACKSACDAFGEPQYCCSGAFSTPDKCKPSQFSTFFKKACPSAYSYAYDDATSTFTCSKADYLITFCPTSATDRSSGSGSGSQTLDEPPLPPPPPPRLPPQFSLYLPNASASFFQTPNTIGLVIFVIFNWLSPF